MIHRAGQVGVRERDATMRRVAQHIPRRRLAAHAEEETRLRVHVRVTPAIQDDPRDVATRIEPARREHVGELLPERALVLRERRPQELRPPLRPLLRVKSSLERPSDTFVAVPYRNHWYWIDDRDIPSKRMFSFIMFIFTLVEPGTREAPPVLTIPTG